MCALKIYLFLLMAHYATGCELIIEPACSPATQVTGVSNRFEEKLGRSALVPFLLEDKLKEARTHKGCFDMSLIDQ